MIGVGLGEFGLAVGEACGVGVGSCGIGVTGVSGVRPHFFR